jgi:hypothetical protein
MNKLLLVLCNKHVFAKMSFKVSIFSLMVSLELVLKTPLSYGC